MAERIDPDNLPPRFRTGARPKYPWAEWTDGSWWEATKGVDYTVLSESLRTALIYHAKQYGLKVTTQLTERGIAFQFTRTETTEESK